MAISVKEAAKGNAPSTGTPGFTPAPTKPQPPDVTMVRNPTAAGYGMNGYTGRSSVDPGKTVISPLAAAIKADVNDPALDAVIASGMGKKTTIDSSSKLTGQERPISDTPFPPAHGMRSRVGEK